MANLALVVDKDLLKKIEGFASRGITMRGMASLLGIATGTLYEYRKRFPEINDAWRKGKYKGAVLAGSAIMDIIQDEKHKDRLRAAEFYLSRQHGDNWRDKIDVNLIPKPTIIERFNSDKEVVLGAAEYSEIEDDDE